MVPLVLSSWREGMNALASSICAKDRTKPFSTMQPCPKPPFSKLPATFNPTEWTLRWDRGKDLNEEQKKRRLHHQKLEVWLKKPHRPGPAVASSPHYDNQCVFPSQTKKAPYATNIGIQQLTSLTSAASSFDKAQD